MLKSIALWAALCVLFAGCIQDGGTEIPNELVGKEIIATGGPAADAEVMAVPVTFVPNGHGGDSGNGTLFSGRTDADGRFAFKGMVPGRYNLIVSKGGLHSFRDSVPVTGKAQALADDSLYAPGSLTGTVLLRAPDSPRSAIVQVLGTTIFVNVGADGSFTLKNLGAGQYRLSVVTTLPGYTPLFKEFTIVSGKDDTLFEPLQPFTSTIPVVENLSVVPDSNGVLFLKWSKSEYANAKAYLIYRDPEGTLLPGDQPIARVADTVYADTLYRIVTSGGIESVSPDSLPHTYTYRIKILAQSGEVGPSFGFVDGNAVPPKTHNLPPPDMLWKEGGALPADGPRSLVVFQDKMWLMTPEGGWDAFHQRWVPDSVFTIWSSPDGSAWKKEYHNDAFPGNVMQMIVFRNQLWILGQRANTMRNDTDFSMYEQTLWKSPDGIQWSEAVHRADFPGRLGCALIVFQDRLWILGGDLVTPVYAHDAWSSGNGTEWRREYNDLPFRATTESIAASAGKMWIIGGSDYGAPNTRIFSSVDGKVWEQAPAAASLEILPRSGHTLTEHGGKLWIMEGYLESFPGTFVSQRRDIWNSSDGITWKKADDSTTFTPRSGHVSVSFGGKLWVMGGEDQAQPQDSRKLSDIWYHEGP